MSTEDKIFTVDTLPGVGRVLTAARDIAAWELVLEDTCLVIAPNDFPVCLGCLGQVCCATNVHWLAFQHDS